MNDRINIYGSDKCAKFTIKNKSDVRYLNI